MSTPYFSEYYELPFFAECPECGTTLFEPECAVCAEADAGEYWEDAA